MTKGGGEGTDSESKTGDPKGLTGGQRRRHHTNDKKDTYPAVPVTLGKPAAGDSYAAQWKDPWKGIRIDSDGTYSPRSCSVTPIQSPLPPCRAPGHPLFHHRLFADQEAYLPR